MNSMTLTHSAAAVEDDSKGWKLVSPDEVSTAASTDHNQFDSSCWLLSVSALCAVCWCQVPGVTYASYVSLAAIEPSTREALRACLEYPFASYSPPNLRTLHTYTSSHLALYRRVSTRYGLVDHCVRASRPIAAGTAVCMLGGRLTESWKVDAQVQLEHGFALKRDELRTFFDFNGEASLVLLTDQHSNIAKYIRDPLHRHSAEQTSNSQSVSQQRKRELHQTESDETEQSEDDDETVGVDSNCRPDTYFDRQSRLFFVLLYATEDIAKGQELFAHRFLGDWRTKAHHEMFLAARVSHWLHRYVLALETRLLTVMAPDKVPAPPAPISLSKLSFWHEAERMVHSAMNGVHDRKLLMEVQTMQTQPQTLAAITLDDALHITGCEFARQTVLGCSISSSTKRKLGRLPNFINSLLVIDGTEHPVSEEDVFELIERGHNDELVEVQEVLSITSPTRFFTVPSTRAFCVTAKLPISAGQLISVYSGELEESVQFPGSNYVYNLPNRDAQQNFGREYDLPDLLLDAHSKGGISRFINDSAWRGGQRDDQRAVNVGVCWAHVRRPVLIVYALKSIAAADELITSYGSEFWSIMSKQSMSDQRQFQCACRPYIEQLEQLCEERGLSLPDKPDYDIEQQPLFQPKPLPYATRRRREESVVEDDEDVTVKQEAKADECKEERKEDLETNGSASRRLSTEQLGRGLRSKRSRPVEVQPPKQQPSRIRPRRTSKRLLGGEAKDEWLGDKPAFVTAVDDEKEYTVERIIKETWDKQGKRWYFVKWLGWPEADNSWVREADMGCDELMAAFREEQSKRMDEIVQRIKETKQRRKEEREHKWRTKEEEQRRQQEEKQLKRGEDGNSHVDSESDSRRRSGRVRKPPADPHEERQAALLLEPKRPRRAARPLRAETALHRLSKVSDASGLSVEAHGEDRSLAAMLAERGWVLSRPTPAHDDGADDDPADHDEADSDEQADMEDSDAEVVSGNESEPCEVVTARVIVSVDSGGSITYNPSVSSLAVSLTPAVSSRDPLLFHVQSTSAWQGSDSASVEPPRGRIIRHRKSDHRRLFDSGLRPGESPEYATEPAPDSLPSPADSEKESEAVAQD